MSLMAMVSFVMVPTLLIVYAYHLWLGVVSFMEFDVLRRVDFHELPEVSKYLTVLSVFNFLVFFMVCTSPSTRNRAKFLMHKIGFFTGNFVFSFGLGSNVVDVFLPHAIVRIPLVIFESPIEELNRLHDIEIVNFYIACSFISLAVLWRLVWSYYVRFFENASDE